MKTMINTLETQHETDRTRGPVLGALAAVTVIPATATATFPAIWRPLLD